MNPGRANQISSFRSENLLCNQRPEAANDKSSPVSGVCLCLLKTLRDLSPSSPLCRDDTLSFQASRWPFVYDDLLIFLLSSSGLISYSPTCRCCSPLIIACREDGRTSSCNQQRSGKKKTQIKRRKMDDKTDSHFWLAAELLMHRGTGTISTSDQSSEPFWDISKLHKRSRKFYATSPHT